MTRLAYILFFASFTGIYAGDGVERSKTLFARQTTIPTDIVVLDRHGQVSSLSGSLTYRYPRKTAYLLGSTAAAGVVTTATAVIDQLNGVNVNLDRIAEAFFMAEIFGITVGIFTSWVAEDIIYQDARFRSADNTSTDYLIVSKGPDSAPEADRFRFFRRLFSVRTWRLPGSSDDYVLERIALNTEEIKAGVLAIEDVTLQLRSLRTGDTVFTTLEQPQPKGVLDCLAGFVGLS